MRPTYIVGKRLPILQRIDYNIFCEESQAPGADPVW